MALSCWETPVPMHASGVHHFWAFAPALDAQEVYAAAAEQCSDVLPTLSAAEDEEPLNVLLLTPSDPHSVLKTLSQRLRHGRRPLHIYVYDRPVEVIARHVLLPAVACDFELPIRQRSSVYLEVFGNCLVQERTSKYLSQKRLELVDLLCNNRGPLHNLFDFSHLKYRHRDELETVFKSWDHRIAFDMHTLRDYRLRHHFGERYDHRNNLIDWDYQASIKPSAGNIHFVLYRHWRNTGIAFEFGDQTYTVPNRTLASYAEGKERGRGTTMRRGFWTDVVVSPYHSLGTALSVYGKLSEQLFEVHNRHTGSEQWRHNTVEVAVVNLLSYMYELETGKRYALSTAHEIYSGLGVDAMAGTGAAPAPAPAGGSGSEEPSTEVVPPPVIAPSAATGTAEEAASIALQVAAAFSGVKVIPVTGDFTDLLKRKHFHRKFDYVEFSSHSVHHLLNEGVVELFADNAVVVAEVGRNVVDLQDFQKALFEQKVLRMAGELGAVYAGTEVTLTADKQSPGTVIASGRHKERIEKTAQRARVANSVVDAKARSMFSPHTPGVEAALKMVHRMNDCASEDTSLGEKPRPQYFGFVWSRSAAGEVSSAFKRIVAEVPPVEMPNPVASDATAKPSAVATDAGSTVPSSAGSSTSTAVDTVPPAK